MRRVAGMTGETQLGTSLNKYSISNQKPVDLQAFSRTDNTIALVVALVAFLLFSTAM